MKIFKIFLVQNWGNVVTKNILKTIFYVHINKSTSSEIQTFFLIKRRLDWLHKTLQSSNSFWKRKEKYQTYNENIKKIIIVLFQRYWYVILTSDE